MIKNLAIGVLVYGCLAATQAMADSEFSGHWKGTGTYQSEDLQNAIPADFDITIAHSDSAISINECWTIPDQYTGKKTTCYKSDYSVNESAQVFANGKKIGDIFPGRILVFQGNDQASELMTFDLNSSRELRFRYSYSNFDGGINIQFAEIPEIH
ncbi:MAG: hypothetical protein ACXVA9_03040 [Bdellovibrionales bacterium]